MKAARKTPEGAARVPFQGSELAFAPGEVAIGPPGLIEFLLKWGGFEECEVPDLEPDKVTHVEMTIGGVGSDRVQHTVKPEAPVMPDAPAEV
jgi:hypothetical protein